MMGYQAPLNDIQFCLDHIIGAGELAQKARFAEATPEMTAAALSEAGRLCEESIAPHRREADLEGARHTGEGVVTPASYKQSYKAIAEGGWVCVSAEPDYGGMGLPFTLQCAVNEMFCSADMSLQLCPLLTQGQIEALSAHASEEIRCKFLPKLISGEWTGAMNLTEPQAGTDLAALRAKAEPKENGAYSISGTKIYITWGDHDCAENICHLVLARLPDAPKGVKGISLFLVPKFLEDGAQNAVKSVSIEKKLGIHGSPTCVMAYEGATGWLIGEENNGLACMFTMMNNARLAVGVQGVAIAEGAHQLARAYAAERRQGRTVVGDGSGNIIDHPDVRRMLYEQRALAEACRAICLSCGFALDMAQAAENEEDRHFWRARAALLTPIAKAFSTDMGVRAADLGVQIHGGMGFIEESGAPQYLRDGRIAPIYEGANGVQALDLVGRKLMHDQGQAMKALLSEIRAEADAEGPLAEMASDIGDLAGDERAMSLLLSNAPQEDKLAGATDFLMFSGYLLGGAYLLRGARAAAAMIERGDGDAEYLKARIAVARFYHGAMLPLARAHQARALAGAGALYAVAPEALSA